MVTGYCVKCKKKGVELLKPEMHITARGGYMVKGKHKPADGEEACGTTVCAMMSKVNAEEAMKNGVPKAA
jgi:hypothetical protein